MIRTNSFSILPLEKLTKQVNYGFTASATQKGNSKFLRITDIQNDRVNWNTVPYCDCGEEDKKKYILEPGDIVFARTGATTGKSFLIQNCPKNSVFASYLIRVRPSSDIDSKYLAWFFQTPNYWNQITQNATGTTQPGVNATNLKKLKVPFPPLEEQKRIAAILDKADAIRRSRKKAIALTEELLRSTFLDMFGDPGENPLKFETGSINKVCSKVTDGTHHMPKTLETGIPILRALNIKNNSIDTSNLVYISEEEHIKISKRSPLEIGDVLLTCLGTIGNVAIFEEKNKFSLVRNIALIKPNFQKTTSEFLQFLLKTNYLQAQMKARARQSSQAALYIGEIEKLKIFLPPISLQKEFSEICKHNKKLLLLYQQDYEEQDNLFNSLLQKAFRGEL